jgi:hypothetical protein
MVALVGWLQIRRNTLGSERGSNSRLSALFSARQLVTIVVSVCAAIVLAPTAVYAAVTATSVHISDPTYPSREAHVTTGGKLYVGDGSGALTVDGKVKVTDGSGALSVDGTVKARPVAPAQPWNPVNYVAVSAGASRAALFSALVPTKLNLTSFTVAAGGATAGAVTLDVQVYVSDSGAGDCVALTGASFGAAERFRVFVPVGQTVNLAYPTPLVYTAYGSTGDRYCVDVSGSGPTGYSAYIAASGFLS